MRTARPPRTIRPVGLFGALWSLLAAGALVWPAFVLLAQLRWSQVLPDWSGQTPALWTSAAATAAALAVTAVAGTPLGFWLARGRSRLWRAVEFALFVPLLLPPLVIGLLLVYILGPYTFVGKAVAAFGLSGTNSLAAIIAAEIYESMPYYVFAAQAAFSQVNPALERASWALGRSPWATFWGVTAPLARPGLTVGAAMAFARALGAFGAVIIVAYDPHTLPVAIWVALNERGLPAAWPIAALLVAVSLPLPLAAILWREIRDARGRD